MGKIIGIDLGTTNSVVAVMEGKEVEVIVNSEGKRTTPSVVSFGESGERKIGQAAKRQAVANPERTVASVKRFMGREFDNSGSDRERVPYGVVKRDNGYCGVLINDKQYTPQEISSMVLQRLKKAAEDFLGTEVTEAVITVPAYFNDSQRKATIEAGEIAGLQVKRIINEPTAAALAYHLDEQGNSKVAVFDLGGGTFDISILEIGDGIVEVLSTNGDTHLGGDDFDQVIVNWIYDQIKSDYNFTDFKTDARQRIRDAAEQAKIELSNSDLTTINLPYLFVVDNQPQSVEYDLSRSKFEQLSNELFQRCLTPCEKALTDAGLTAAEIDEVIMVGGSTRIPEVQNRVKQFFNKTSLNHSVNPDEVVAIGAAVQGGILSGDVNDILLIDVVPLSMGIETLGGVFTKMIEANTKVPSSKVETYSTAADNQTSVEIHVLQGERPMARDNKSLGRFHLDGIPPAPRGVPQIEVTFDIDANSILTVKALDKNTGKQQSIRIEGSGTLSDAEIERMRNEAEQYAEQDQETLRVIEETNKGETVLFSVENQLNDVADKISEGDRENVNRLIEDLRTEIQNCRSNNNLGVLDEKIKALTDAWYQISSTIQQPAGDPNMAGADNAGEDDLSGEETIDAEVVDN